MLKDYLHYLWGRLQTLLASLFGTTVIRRRRRFRRSRFTAGRSRNEAFLLRVTTWAGMALCGAVFLAGAVKLAGYGIEWLSSASSSQQMRQAYYETGETAPPAVPPVSAAAQLTQTAAPEKTAAPSAAPTAAEETPAASASGTLKARAYPDNRNLIVNSRFDGIRRQNKDIIGWLTIDGMIDEPVAQRDNIYYMTRDYLGQQNVNGAIFLDEIINLKNRPYTLILYGHNMKSGAMFGSLRYFENPAYYRANPFISFDSIYEDGRYVVFAAAMVSIEQNHPNYLNVGKLISGSVKNRNEVLAMLRDASAVETAVTVNADDQVLLLVTCVGDDSERRVIAARRLREDETEAEIARIAQQCRAR